jgi:ABC-2 type transport system permease protein
MRRLILAELLKPRTTRTGVLFLAGVAALVAIAVTAPGALVGQKHDPHTIVEGAASLALTLTLLLGITMSAGDEQHGDLVNSLLVAPGRVRLVVAKALAGVVAGALLALITALSAIGLVEVTSPGTSGLPTQEIMLTASGILLAGPLFALIGIGVGIVLRSQAVAVGASLVWLYAGEQLISQLSYPVYLWLPGGAREALLRHVSTTHTIPPMWVGGVLLVAYAVGACAVGATLLRRRDLT